MIAWHLGDIDRVVIPATEPPPLEATSVPAHGPRRLRALRADGQLTAREIMSIVPKDAEDVLRALFGLMRIGFVRYGSHHGRRHESSDSASAGCAAIAEQAGAARGRSSGGCGAGQRRRRPRARTVAPRRKRPPAPAPEAEAFVRELIARMTLEEKIAQLRPVARRLSLKDDSGVFSPELAGRS